MFTCRAFLCTCSHIFHAHVVHSGVVVWGTCCMGLCRHCVQVADTLAVSFFLLASRAYFHRSRLTIFPLLPDIQFSAVPSSNNKGAEKIILHVDSGCFVWGRGHVDCFPRPQCSLSKCSPLHGKGKGGKNYKLLQNLCGFVHPRRGGGPWAGGRSAQSTRQGWGSAL